MGRGIGTPPNARISPPNGTSLAETQPMAERFFNTSGPVVPADHYCIPPLERFDLDEVLRLIRQKRYFVLHAPRQTGKTSALLALRDLLNEADEHRCLYANVEAGQAARGDVAGGMEAILAELNIRARITFPAATWSLPPKGRWKRQAPTAPCARPWSAGQQQTPSRWWC